MQHDYAGIDVEYLNTAGKLGKRLFPVGVATHDQRWRQRFGNFPDKRRSSLSFTNTA